MVCTIEQEGLALRQRVGPALKDADTRNEDAMNDATKTLNQLKKADKLVRLSFHKNGPKSYRHGQGALLRALLEDDGTTQRRLVDAMGVSRRELKSVVKKAERNGYVALVPVEERRTYRVALTEEGRAVAAKRLDANDRAADEIVACLTAEEREQLDAIAGKLIASAEERGVSDKGKARRGRRSRRRRR